VDKARLCPLIVSFAKKQALGWPVDNWSEIISWQEDVLGMRWTKAGFVHLQKL